MPLPSELVQESADREGDAASAAPPVEPLVVPLRLQSAVAVAGQPQPIAFGVPFPKGRLMGRFSARLLWPDGSAPPHQTRPLACWSDGSVQWLLVDTLADHVPAGVSEVRLEISPGEAASAPRSGVEIRQREDSIWADTGPVQFEFDRRTFRPLLSVRACESDLLAAPASETVLLDRKGRPRRLRVEGLAVEESGPVRTTLCWTGNVEHCRGLRFQARMSLYAGTGLVRLRLTLHNARRARHRGGLWDLGDPGSWRFRDLSLDLGLPTGTERAVFWKAEPDAPLESLAGESLEFYQDSSGGENWQSPNHVNHEGRVPCRFQGYRVRTAAGKSSGRRANPVVIARGGEATLAVSVPEFWQQFPKALEVDAKGVHVRLFPRQWDDQFELQGGERKTHTIWLRFATGEKVRGDELAWTHQPARLSATPEWCADSVAVPYLLPAAEGPPDRFQSLLKEAISDPKSLLAGREVIDEYGWRNYGEVWGNHEEAYYGGSKPIISHYNNQFDVVYGTILQYLRTGDPRWAEVFDPLARHVMDIDIYHTAEDKANYSGGYFWHSDHYRPAATATHRTYSRANRPTGGGPYGGGPSSEHNYARGLLHYYFLTGDRDAREAVLGLADWVIAMDDGAKNLLGLLDDGPTGSASCTASADYHGPGRGSGNSLHVLLDAYQLSREKRYLDKAEELIHRCVHPEEEIEALTLLDAERRWSYTVFLAALARYLDVKAEARCLDGQFAYGRAALVRYARWMAAHERPYLDHPEELEYPTETWAAQELRKANAIRGAIKHADPGLQEELTECANQFAERAWRDLLGFPSRAVARSLAIMMVEGTVDAWWREFSGTTGPSPCAEPVLSSREPPRKFVSQRARVRRSAGGLRTAAAMLARLASPRRWRALGAIVHREIAARIR